MKASGSQYLEENGNGSKATRNDKGGHLPRSRESAIWDLDGDGVLNDAELALKHMAAGNGEIDKHEIYKLMQEHISVQRSLWKFKRIAAAFFVLIFILGIAMAGTSFAVAIIAKDTTASGGNLREKGDGGKTLEPQTFADQTDAFVEPIDASGVCSKLEGTCSGFYKCCPGLVCNANTEECENDPNRTITSVLEINVEQGKAMVEECKRGRTVFLDRKFTHGTDMQLPICPPIGGHKAVYDNKALPSLQIETPRGIVIIAPNDEGTYYTATGEGVTSDKNFPCDETIDCDFGLVCHLEEMADEGLTTEYVNKCVEFYATVSTGVSISSDPTISWTRPPRPSPDDVATVVEATTPAPSPAVISFSSEPPILSTPLFN